MRRQSFEGDVEEHEGTAPDEGQAADEAGSRDYGLFARTMLGAVLTDAGRAAEARGYLEEALEVARDLPSPVGELRATYYMAEMHAALDDAIAARRGFGRAEELASELGVASFLKAAREGLARLQDVGEEEPR